MTRHSQRHRSTTLPFAYRNEGLSLNLHGFSVDGGPQRSFDLKAGQTEIDLASVLQSESGDEVTTDWQSVQISGQVEAPESTIDAVFPPDERERPPAKLYIAVRCHETISRSREDVPSDGTPSGAHDFTLTVHKDDVRGTVEIRPYLVRTEERSGDGEFATGKNFRVASGKQYRLVIDRPAGEVSPAIDGEHASFSQEPHLPDGEKLYYLDFRNESRPKLWINADHPRITDVLQSRGSVGAEARMRDVILDQISYGVWTQLLFRAGCGIDGQGGVEYEWQESVLKTFVTNLYPVNDTDEAIHRFREEISETESLPHLMDRIDRELQEYIDPRTQLINLMEEGLRI